MRAPSAALLIAIAPALAAVPLYAQQHSHFVDSSGRPVGAMVSGSFRLYTLAGRGETTTVLVSKTATSDWAQVVNPPPGVSAFYMPAGIVSSGANVFGSGPRLYLVAAVPAPGLWEYDPVAQQSRPVTGSGGPDLGALPAIAASADIWGYPVIALRTASGQIWTCEILSPASACYWTNGTSGHSVDPSSPVGITGTNTATNDTDIYTIQGSGGPQPGSLQRWGRLSGTWDSIGYPIGPAGTTVDYVSIQAFNAGSTADVVVAAWDHCGSCSCGNCNATDTLQLAQRPSGEGWSWHQLSTPSVPAGGISWAMNNIAVGSDGTYYRIFVEDYHQDHLWACQFSGTSCSWWPNLSRPADERPYWDGFGGAIWADYTHAYLTASIGFAEYIYDYNWNNAEWENHLTLRDPIVPLPSTGYNPGEYSVAEFYGTVATTASTVPGSRTLAWISWDDGSTNQQPVFPFEVSGGNYSCGDESVGFDSDGSLFVTATQPVQDIDPYHAVRIVRRTAEGTWTSGVPMAIPPTATSLVAPMDRPSMAADQNVSNRLFLTWSADRAQGNTGNIHGGRFAYCAGTGADCSSVASAWCPAARSYWLPSSTGCGPISSSAAPSNPGCQVAVGGDGAVWLAIQDDVACSSPPPDMGFPPMVPPCGPTTCPGVADSNWTRSIGIRRVTNSLGSSCASGLSPTLPECIYFVNAASYQVIGTTGERTWTNVLSAAQDVAGRLAVTLQSYRDYNSGGVCNSSSFWCRLEVYSAVRDPALGWCGAAGTSCVNGTSTPVAVSNMLIVSGDRNDRVPPFHYLRRVDHIRGAAVLLDHRRIGWSWMDFRNSSDDTLFALRDAFTQMSIAGDLASAEVESAATPSQDIYTWAPAPVWCGDINAQASGRLHEHHVLGSRTCSGPPPCTSPTIPQAAIQSPFAHWP